MIVRQSDIHVFLSDIKVKGAFYVYNGVTYDTLSDLFANKVSTSDISDSLVSTESHKPASQNAVRQLKNLIDAVSGLSVSGGVFDASLEVVPTHGETPLDPIIAGMYWRTIVPGTIVGVLPDPNFLEGDLIYAKIDFAVEPNDFYRIPGNASLDALTTRVANAETTIIDLGNNKFDKSNLTDDFTGVDASKALSQKGASDLLAAAEANAALQISEIPEESDPIFTTSPAFEVDLNDLDWIKGRGVSISNDLSYALQSDVEQAIPTENTKVITSLRAFQGFIYWCINSIFETLTTTSKNIIGAINELNSNKLSKNTQISGATKTKITYDANGLVTSGADATTSDIADSTNKRYQTDNQQLFNDATSSIQTQINDRVVKIVGDPTKLYTINSSGVLVDTGRLVADLDNWVLAT